MRARLRPWRRLWPLAIPFAAYGAWITFVRWRVGAWSFAAHSGRLTAVPFAGFVQSLHHSLDRNTTIFWFIVGLVVVAYAFTRGRRDSFYASAVGFGSWHRSWGPKYGEGLPTSGVSSCRSMPSPRCWRTRRVGEPLTASLRTVRHRQIVGSCRSTPLTVPCEAIGARDAAPSASSTKALQLPCVAVVRVGVMMSGIRLVDIRCTPG